MLSVPGKRIRFPIVTADLPCHTENHQTTAFLTTNTSVLSLRFIATSDLHACLLPYDYCANRPASGRGLAEVARQIALARAEVPNSLLFDNGDFLQGNPLADFVASVERRRRAHPMIAAFNALRYDAATLGNHDFDYGIDFLSKSIAHASFPVISANVATRFGKTPAGDQTLVPPYALLRRRLVDQDGRKHNLRIGVIGFAPPQSLGFGRDHLQGRIGFRDILAAARAWLPRLKAAGADVIVALAHSGIGQLDPEDGAENAATAIAALPEVDAVIAGHSHQTFPGPGFSGLVGVDADLGRLAGKPAVMPGHSGSHLGIIDLVLAPSQTMAGKWQIVGREVKLGAPLSRPAPLPKQLHRAIAPDHRAALAWSRRSLGRTAVALTSYFATVAPSAAIQLVAAAKIDHVRRSLSGTALGKLPLLAAASLFRAGGLGGAQNYTNILAGHFRMRNLSDLYPFQNRLITLALNVADVADWLEHSASIFCQIRPGDRDTPLHDPRFPAFAFDCIPGLDYAIDLSQPPRFDRRGHIINPSSHRIVGISLEGRPLDPTEPLLLVTNNHRISRIQIGAGNGPQVVLDDGVRAQAVLAEYVRAQGVVGYVSRRNWHFLPMPGTSALVMTGPGAADQLADVAPMRPDFLQQDDAGFLHYRLHL